ncbi:hypothetical protein PR048_031059 [Dryococelus australis]|uniref:Uncharacterized protein n=1 Tax=Dryococelus australis TaxID=614101 RepID=A0ABQ9G464_9NEOP|nr:hypothetical protein PR048_031059 [Dryococelus australis]
MEALPSGCACARSSLVSVEAGCALKARFQDPTGVLAFLFLLLAACLCEKIFSSLTGQSGLDTRIRANDDITESVSAHRLLGIELATQHHCHNLQCFNGLQASLCSLMYKYADINCALVVCCHRERRRLDQRSPGGVKHHSNALFITADHATLTVLLVWAAVVQWSDNSPSTKTNLPRFPAWSLSGFSSKGVVVDDFAGRRVFSGISSFSRTSILALLHTHLASPSSALKTSLLRAAGAHNRLICKDQHIQPCFCNVTHFNTRLKSFEYIIPQYNFENRIENDDIMMASTYSENMVYPGTWRVQPYVNHCITWRVQPYVNHCITWRVQPFVNHCITWRVQPYVNHCITWRVQPYVNHCITWRVQPFVNHCITWRVQPYVNHCITWRVQPFVNHCITWRVQPYVNHCITWRVQPYVNHCITWRVQPFVNHCITWRVQPYVNHCITWRVQPYVNHCITWRVQPYVNHCITWRVQPYVNHCITWRMQPFVNHCITWRVQPYVNHCITWRVQPFVNHCITWRVQPYVNHCITWRVQPYVNHCITWRVQPFVNHCITWRVQPYVNHCITWRVQPYVNHCITWRVQPFVNHCITWRVQPYVNHCITWRVQPFVNHCITWRVQPYVNHCITWRVQPYVNHCITWRVQPFVNHCITWRVQPYVNHCITWRVQPYVNHCITWRVQPFVNHCITWRVQPYVNHCITWRVQPYVILQSHDGNTARLVRRSDEALVVRVSVARIAPSLLDLESAGAEAARERGSRQLAACYVASIRCKARLCYAYRNTPCPLFRLTTSFITLLPRISNHDGANRALVSEEIWTALNSEVLRADKLDREDPPTNGIVRHDSHMRNPVTRPGIELGSPWWEASGLTARLPRMKGRSKRSGARRVDRTPNYVNGLTVDGRPEVWTCSSSLGAESIYYFIGPRQRLGSAAVFGVDTPGDTSARGGDFGNLPPRITVSKNCLVQGQPTTVILQRGKESSSVLVCVYSGATSRAVRVAERRAERGQCLYTFLAPLISAPLYTPITLHWFVSKTFHLFAHRAALLSARRSAINMPITLHWFVSKTFHLFAHRAALLSARRSAINTPITLHWFVSKTFHLFAHRAALLSARRSTINTPITLHWFVSKTFHLFAHRAALLSARRSAINTPITLHWFVSKTFHLFAHRAALLSARRSAINTPITLHWFVSKTFHLFAHRAALLSARRSAINTPITLHWFVSKTFHLFAHRAALLSARRSAINTPITLHWFVSKTFHLFAHRAALLSARRSAINTPITLHWFVSDTFHIFAHRAALLSARRSAINTPITLHWFVSDTFHIFAHRAALLSARRSTINTPITLHWFVSKTFHLFAHRAALLSARRSAINTPITLHWFVSKTFHLFAHRAALLSARRSAINTPITLHWFVSKTFHLFAHRAALLSARRSAINTPITLHWFVSKTFHLFAHRAALLSARRSAINTPITLHWFVSKTFHLFAHRAALLSARRSAINAPITLHWFVSDTFHIFAHRAALLSARRSAINTPITLHWFVSDTFHLFAHRAHKAEEYTMCIQVALKKGFQKCSLYSEQPTKHFNVRTLSLGVRSQRVHSTPHAFYDLTTERDCRGTEVALAKRLNCSPPIAANRVQSPAGSFPDLRKWDRRVSSRISPFLRTFIPALLYTHLALPSSTLKSTLLRAAQISSLTRHSTFGVLRSDEGKARFVWSGVGMERRGKRKIPEKTRGPAAYTRWKTTQCAHKYILSTVYKCSVHSEQTIVPVTNARTALFARHSIKMKQADGIPQAGWPVVCAKRSHPSSAVHGEVISTRRSMRLAAGKRLYASWLRVFNGGVKSRPQETAALQKSCFNRVGAAVTERLAYPPPAKMNKVPGGTGAGLSKPPLQVTTGNFATLKPPCCLKIEKNTTTKLHTLTLTTIRDSANPSRVEFKHDSIPITAFSAQCVWLSFEGCMSFPVYLLLARWLEAQWVGIHFFFSMFAPSGSKDFHLIELSSQFLPPPGSQDEQDSIPGRATAGFSHVGIVPGFLGDIPFPPPFHSGAASYSHVTLIGSPYLDIKSRPNLFTHSRFTPIRAVDFSC